MWDSAYVAPTFLGLTLVRFMETLYEGHAHMQVVGRGSLQPLDVALGGGEERALRELAGPF